MNKVLILLAVSLVYALLPIAVVLRYVVRSAQTAWALSSNVLDAFGESIGV